MKKFLLLLVLLPVTALASYPEYRVPGHVAVRRATVLSEGVPLVAHVLQAREQSGKRLPTVIFIQGTGGLQHYHLHPAVMIASAGFTVITFDFRGWGESAGRLVHADPKAAARTSSRPFSTEVIEVRETVDPVEQVADVLAVINWAVGEPEVDGARIGVWGTSLGATIALQAALNDSRVRAVVAQVGAYDLRAGGARLEDYRRDAARRARGELPYAGPRPRVQGQLHGQRIGEKYVLLAPGADLGRLAARPGTEPALLIIDAANEDLFDIRQHGQRLYDNYPGTKERVVMPGIRHYDIYYGAPLGHASRLALEWYEKNLK